MESEAYRIKQYLLEDISEGYLYNDFIPESDHDEEDHISESNHETDTESDTSVIDDSDINPDFIPESDATSVVESSDSEKDIGNPPAKDRGQSSARKMLLV